MRIVFVLLCTLLLGACASGKKAREAKEAAAARRQANASASGDNRSGSSTASGSSNWRITSIKGRFLNHDSTTVRIYLNVTPQRGNGPASMEDLMAHFTLNYVVYPDYNSRERLGYGNVPLTAQSVARNGNINEPITVFFDVKKPSNAITGVLLAEFTETTTGRKVLHDLPLRFRAAKLSDRFAFFNRSTNLPEMRHYANQGDTVLLKDLAGTQRQLHLFRYQYEFDPAASPMNTTPRPAARTLSADSALTITTNQPFVVPQEGLYYFVEDTTDTYGIGLLVADSRFPRLTRPEKLVKPVMYMSTSQEITDLTTNKDAKKALDRYWLTLMAGNQEVARRAIRAYYNRVEEANRLFTTYKEGWKTDKGMIYIILGPPDRVQRSRDREVWVYNQRANVSEINFTFNRKPNQFVDDHYDLVRYVEYQPIWYPVVEAWRNGAIQE